jgi:iron complex transport system substrate-binding protein
VASLLPAATEMVCALGGAQLLVGISHECDFPAAVSGLPVLTRSKLIERRESRAIDLDVREILRRALSVYDIDTEALVRAAPDVILTQDLCEVCAVSIEDVRRAVGQLLPQARLVNLHPTRLADLWSGLREVGAALGLAERAELEIERLAARLDAIARRARRLAHRPRVLTIEWIDPVMIGGTWMPELVEIAGGRALVTQAGEAAKTLSFEQLRALRPAPEIVVVKPCGFRLERSLAEFAALRELFQAMPWPALRSGDLFLADGNAFFNRPGPRLVESTELLAGVLHPASFEDFAEKYSLSVARLAR